jgi:hypothetical protein
MLGLLEILAEMARQVWQVNRDRLVLRVRKANLARRARREYGAGEVLWVRPGCEDPPVRPVPPDRRV